MRKILLFWLLFVLALTCAVYLSVRIIMVAANRTSAANITNISVTAKNGRVNKSAVAMAIGINAKTPTYKVSLDDVLTKVLSIPDIEKASVRRLGNGNLQINVQLRTVIAFWTDGENYYPLSRDGAVINRPEETRPDNAMIFKGILPDDVEYFAETAKRFPGILEKTDYIERISGYRWNIVTINGITIKLPENDAYSAISKCAEMDKKSDILSRDFAVLDLRGDSRVFVKLK